MRFNKSKSLFILILLQLIALTGGLSTVWSDSVKETEDNFLTSLSVEEIAAEFRQVRKIKSHFNGGTWNDKVDKWMGRKHRLMIALDNRLTGEQYDRSGVKRLLGPPDEIVRKGDNLFKLIARQMGHNISDSSSYEFLVYHWRGRHDFLFFACQDNVIISSDWWYAGE